MHVADCNYNIADTAIYNTDAIKINYTVKTTTLYDFFFKIDNKYEVVIDKSTYRVLYYSKTSSQPNVVNNITTYIEDDNIKYSNDLLIYENETNIFVLLYLLCYNKNLLNNYDIIDREGKKYTYNINEIENNIYNLSLTPLDDSPGLVDHTDIFSWALFLPNTKKYIYIDEEKKLIKKCLFRKKFLNINAEIK